MLIMLIICHSNVFIFPNCINLYFSQFHCSDVLHFIPILLFVVTYKSLVWITYLHVETIALGQIKLYQSPTIERIKVSKSFLALVFNFQLILVIPRTISTLPVHHQNSRQVQYQEQRRSTRDHIETASRLIFHRPKAALKHLRLRYRDQDTELPADRKDGREGQRAPKPGDA